MQSAAHGKASGRHDQTADKELIAAEGDGIFLLAVFLDQYGGKCRGDGGQQHEAFAHEGDGAVQTGAVEIDQNHTCKSQNTADQLPLAQFFIVENQAGQQDGKKHVGSLNDGAFDAAGVSQADVEQQILDHSLSQTQLDHHAPGRFLRNQKLLLEDTSNGDGQNTGQSEPASGEENLRSSVRGFNGKQAVADFDAGKSAAPEKAADEGQQSHHCGFLQAGR